jgi:dTDP-4-amino-4,6-dideoxygalactose transaminase
MVSSVQMTVPFLDLGAQLDEIEADVKQAIDRVIAAKAFVLGPSVEQFEEHFAAYCHVRHALGVSSGTAALHLALLACGVGPGDEVITAAHTFIASCWAITYAGARPVLVDVDPETLTIDPHRIPAAVTARTRAIVPVHLYGQPADMDPIMAIARHHHLAVVEDACQAHGARYKGRRVGSIGDIGCFSFYPGKNLGAFGEAGAVVTNDATLAATVRKQRNHGQAQRYHHDVLGFNYRMDGIQAAVLNVKLRHLERWNSRRREHAHAYDALLAACPGLRLTRQRDDSESVYHLYVVRSDRRDALRAYLAEQGIDTGLHYPVPIDRQPAYAELGYAPGDFPITEEACATLLSLPMYAELTPHQVAYVAQTVCEFQTVQTLGRRDRDTHDVWVDDGEHQALLRRVMA